MHKLNKVRVWGLLGVFLLSFAISIAQPYTAQAADADNKSAAEVTRALGYFYTMRRCLAEGLSTNKTDYTNDELNNFSFLVGYKLPLGTQFINKSTGARGDWDGNVNCDGGGEYGNWRNDAVSALGYANPRDMLCNMMHPYQSIAPDETSVSRSATESAYNSCKNGQGKLDVKPLTSLSTFARERNDDERSRAFNNSAGIKYFGWSNPLDRAGIDLNLYMLYRSSFQQFCQPISYDGADIGSDYEKVTIQEPDVETQSTKSLDLLVRKDRLDKKSDVIAHNVLPGTNSTMSCRDMINKINATAAGATTALMSLPPEQQQQAAGSIADAVRGDDSDTPDVVTCTVEGLGWIICPVVTFMAKVTDAAYGFVSSLLKVQPLLTTTSDKGIYGAWSAMRNLANIAFVIAFMVIIFSQVTSVGIGNYGIKKMLPRLIAAAILVNLSYWICAVAVDLSNISGSAVRGLFKSVGATIPSADTGAGVLGIDAATGAGWLGVAGAILGGTLATGAALYIGLSALLPALIVVLMAIVTVVLVLVLRQALIILLIAAAPLAFVAFLLPNTEGLFDKWRKLFTTLLLMYPIIAGIFGASALASTIIMEGAKNNQTDYKIAIQIMGAAVAIIPLFITPVVMKSAGGLLNRFGGVINNPNKGPFDRLRKGAERIRENQEGKRAIRAMNGGVVLGGGRFRRRARRDAVSQGIKNEANRATNQYIAEEIEGNSSFRNRVAGGSRGLYTPNATQEAMQRALSGAKLTIEKAVAEDIQAESVIVRDLNDSALKAILSSNVESEAKKAAAMQRLIKITDPGGPDGYASEVNAAISGNSDILRRATAEALAKDGPGFIKGSDIDKIATGAAKNAGTTLQSIAQKNVADGVYSQEKMVDETHGNLQFAFDNAYTVNPTTGAVDRTGQQNMVNTSAALLVNSNLNGKIKHNRVAITDLSVGSRPR